MQHQYHISILSIQHPSIYFPNPVSYLLHEPLETRWAQIIIIVYCSIGIACVLPAIEIPVFIPSLPAARPMRLICLLKRSIFRSKSRGYHQSCQSFSERFGAQGRGALYHGNRQHIGRYAKPASSISPGPGMKCGWRIIRVSAKAPGTQRKEIVRAGDAGTQDGGSEVWYRQRDRVWQVIRHRHRGLCGVGIQLPLKLILETPHYSIPALFSCYAPIYPTSYMATYKIRTFRFRRMQCPVSIFTVPMTA